MKVTWEVEDGYMGGSRPQTTTINDDELLDCDDTEERKAVIEEYIQQDFEQTIFWAGEVANDLDEWEKEHAEELKKKEEEL